MYPETVSADFESVCEEADVGAKLMQHATMSDALSTSLSASARWCHVLDCGA
jgi:hypothetical protein